MTVYRSPYTVFKSIYGEYDPDCIVHIFSVWMSEEKSAYLLEHPEAKRNQIDGYFVEAELERFFRWISGRTRAKTKTYNPKSTQSSNLLARPIEMKPSRPE